MSKWYRKGACAALLLGLATPWTAAAEDLQQKVESLEKELQALKQQVQETDRKAGKIEEKSLGRWLTIGGDYRFRVDSLRGQLAGHTNAGAFVQGFSALMPQVLAGDLTQEQAMGQAIQGATSKGYNVKNDTLYTNRFGLNLKAKATQDVTVNARLLMYKIAGEQDDRALRADNGNTAYFADRAGLFDGTLGHVPGDSRLLVDRAYATWANIADQPIWFSVGRRPSTNGVPTNLRMNVERPGNGGTPALLVDYAFDGMTLGYAPDIEMLPGFYTKLCYGRGFESGLERQSSNNTLEDTDMLGVAIVPYETDALRIDFQYNRAFNVFNAPTMLTGPFPNAGITGPSKDLGEIDWFGLGAMGQVKLGKNRLQLFLHNALSLTHPNDSVWKPFGDNFPGVGLMYSEGQKKEDKLGWATYVGARYDIESTATKIGFEFNHGSKDWITFAPAADDMWTSKLGTRGNVYEGYLIQELKLKPISSYLSKTFFRLGYQYYDFDYTGSNFWVGSPVKISSLDNPQNMQMLAPLKRAQDIYATFEVHF